MDDKTLRDIFDRWAPSFDSTVLSGKDWIDRDYSQGLSRLAAECGKLAAEVPVPSVLDAGCGTGNLLTELDKHLTGYEYTGIDLSPEMIRIARQKRPEGKFLVSRMLDYTAPCDIPVCSYALHHYQGKILDRIVGHLLSLSNLGVLLILDILWQDSGQKDQTVLEAKATGMKDVAEEIVYEPFPTCKDYENLLSVNDGSLELVWVASKSPLKLLRIRCS